jgi:hypothetical protein
MSPSSSRASAATALGKRRPKLFPHFEMCVIIVMYLQWVYSFAALGVKAVPTRPGHRYVAASISLLLELYTMLECVLERRIQHHQHVVRRRRGGRSFMSLPAAAEEAALSRIFAGTALPLRRDHG